ncbi:MAG: YidC/Oxa1 family membrane protein insertase [Actinomycetota bacterium]
MGFFEIFASALAGFYAVIPSYGVAIILLTITVRLMLLPLSIKQTRSMREMQLIQPEVKKLQAKYKGNRQKMNEELMALYKEHGVNPLGGCLPLLMQFPVLIGLFYVIRTPLKYMGYESKVVGGAIDWIQKPVSGFMDRIQDSSFAHGLDTMPLKLNSFLGIRLDCTPSDAVGSKASDAIPSATCGNGFLDALPYLVIVALIGLTTYYQSRQMQATRGSTADNPQAQQMQMMTRIMPVLIMVFSYGFATGVGLYWLTTNIWTIGQQRLMLRAAPPLTPGSKADGKGAKKPDSKPPTGTPAKAPPGKAPAGTGDTGTGTSPSKPHPSSKKRKRRR